MGSETGDTRKSEMWVEMKTGPDSFKSITVQMPGMGNVIQEILIERRVTKTGKKLQSFGAGIVN